ncbi:sugar ABC transporter ATP-binding protein [Stieleria sp. TO1_6]|uniref:sugar ABC transporter ATP-binding protein n=1 Tax=Stieleria tagensis TaxID=2956795 RepID=UPI00209A7624|nr:sugar ABC transporter ATP-binding protein [Stieleria tagensis]MCO8123637.1 sugar ABC transporter ATP-binding protein [Stieleria tagensis]
MSELLAVTGMTKRYGSVTVLRDVAFDLKAGEIHALLGANGAGKSTLCKMVAGLTDVSGGQMQLGGEPYAPADKPSAETAGVQIVQQELNLIPTLNVAENLLLTRLPSRFGIVQHGDLHRRARAALDRLGLSDIQTHTQVGRLGVGRQQMVEIATALDRQCRVLILDEPTAALSGSETERLFEQLFRLREQGVGMIYISHRLDEVKRIADRTTVLRDGKWVCTQPTREISTDDMVDLMSGGGTGMATKTASARCLGPADAPVLSVDSLTCGIVQDVSFAVRAGETFGITGLVGSGRTELLRAIFGADPADSGSVTVGNRDATRFSHPADAVVGGLAMVTEDRKQNGLLLDQSIRSNTAINSLAPFFSRCGVVLQQRERTAAQSMCEQMDTRCTGIEQIVGTLSGGNQQKVVVAKWLTRGADVFLFDEPTRGIDVAARRRIYEMIDALASQGKGIVIVSSDLEELFETCDRIAVLSAGRLVRTFDRSGWSEDAILQASFEAHRSDAART